jgi:hypothetical protein
MHPRALARNDCSGGSCPAVYDDDIDLPPEELAIVGKQPRAGLLSRLSGRIAPDENVVTIGREIVRQALRPTPEPISDEELWAQFQAFSYSAVRLEGLQSYVSDEDDAEELAAFAAGRPRHHHRDTQWAALVKASRRWGKTHRRIRVVTEPLTPYVQWELTWGFEANVAAGEDIRVLAVTAGEWPEDVPRSDFWLLDSSKLFGMRYEADGQWASAERITDPERIVEACRACDAALHRAVPLRAYLESRPDLQRRLAQ